MFSIYAKTPVYDDRDAISHSIVSKVSEYSYETAALARRMTPSQYDEQGQCTEVEYFVADATDPWKRPAASAAADDGSNDLPF